MMFEETTVRPWSRKAARFCLLAAQIIFLVWLIRCAAALWFGQALPATSLAMFATLIAVTGFGVVFANLAVIEVLFTRKTVVATTILTLTAVTVLSGAAWVGFTWASVMEETPSMMAGYGAIVSVAIMGVTARATTVMRIAQGEGVPGMPWAIRSLDE